MSQPSRPDAYPDPFDLQKARADTRGCESIIHLNNAGAALMPIAVSDALHHYLREEEWKGSYETANREADSAYSSFDLLNAHRRSPA